MKSFTDFFKIRVKKSGAFYFAIFLIFLLFFVAYIHNNNIAYILMFSIFAILFISFPLGRRNIRRVDLELKYHPKVFAKEKFKYKALLKGRAYAIEIDGKKYNIFDEELIDLEFCFKKRGVNIIKAKELSSSYPLGLVKFIKRVEFNKEVLVYPQLVGKSLEESFFKGNSHLGYKDEFEGLKNYSQSDAISDIHWPSVAKGEIASKKFSYILESDELIFDYNSLSGDKESKISQLALWCVEADKKGYKYSLILGNEKLKDIDEILTKLALY